MFTFTLNYNVSKFYFYNPIIILILTILMMNDREIKN